MALPTVIRREYATQRNSIVQPVYGGDQLQIQDATLIEQGGRGWRTYDVYTEILKDCHAFAVLQKRIKAVTSREWMVEPGGNRAIDRKAADMLREQLLALSSRGDYAEGKETTIGTGGGFDSVCEHLMMAIHYGFQPAEIMWGQDGREVYVDEILPKDLRRFFFVAGDRGYRLRMHDAEKAQANGLVLPHRKFVVHRYASHPTEAPEGLGLGHRLFYPAWFKRQNIKFWLIFADKFASPTAIAKHGPGATAEQKRELLEMLEALATDAGIVVSQDVMVEFIEAARSSTIAVYSELAKFCDEEMSKAVLGETGTTDQSGGGGSRARDEVANGIRLEIAKADADLLSGTLHRTIARWVTWFNFGDRAAVPNIWRRFPELEDKRDLNALAQRDQIIVTMSGRQLTEKYLKETYEVEFEDGPSAAEQAAAIEAEPDINALLSGGSDAANTDTPAATDTANSDPAAQFAEGDDISRIVDRVGTALAEERPIEAVYPELSIDSFAEDLAQRMAIEYLAGRYEVVQEIGDSPEFAEAVAVLEQLQPAAEFAEGDNIELAREVLEQLEPIDFAAKKKGSGAGKNCKKGWSCGYSCISKSKSCKNALTGQSATYADWLAKQSSGSKPKAEAKPKGGIAATGFAKYQGRADELSRDLKSLEQVLDKQNKDMARLWDEGKIEEATALIESPERKRFVQANEEFSALMTAYRSDLIGRSKVGEAEALAIAQKTKLTGFSKAKKAELTASIAEFHQLTNGAGDGKIKTISAKAGRAGTDGEGNIFIDKTVVSSTALGGKTTLFHEMAHNLEDAAQRKRNNSWLASRSKNNAKLEKLSDLAPGEGYRSDELAVRGDFYHPYVGKFYGASPIDLISGKKPQVKNATTPTEVLSMGLEKFVDGEKMRDLYRKDKKHFELMVEYLEVVRV